MFDLGTRVFLEEFARSGNGGLLIDFMRANKTMIHDKSSAEGFQQQLQTQTPAWTRKRNERAEVFVKQVV